MSMLGTNAMAGKWRSGFGMGCLTGVVLAASVLVGLGALVRGAPERFPGPIRTIYGARGVGASGPGAGLSLEQIEAIRGVRPTIAVMLTEDDINSYIRENPDAVGLPRGYSSPRVEFSEGLVRMAGAGGVTARTPPRRLLCGGSYPAAPLPPVARRARIVALAIPFAIPLPAGGRGRRR